MCVFYILYIWGIERKGKMGEKIKERDYVYSNIKNCDYSKNFNYSKLEIENYINV